MIESRGNSNEITRRYLDSLLIETRYMNSRIPELETASVAELCLWNAEALIDLLIHHHKELSPFLIRKLYRVLS